MLCCAIGRYTSCCGRSSKSRRIRGCGWRNISTATCAQSVSCPRLSCSFQCSLIISEHAYDGLCDLLGIDSAPLTQSELAAFLNCSRGVRTGIEVSSCSMPYVLEREVFFLRITCRRMCCSCFMVWFRGGSPCRLSRHGFSGSAAVFGNCSGKSAYGTGRSRTTAPEKPQNWRCDHDCTCVHAQLIPACRREARATSSREAWPIVGKVCGFPIRGVLDRDESAGDAVIAPVRDLTEIGAPKNIDEISIRADSCCSDRARASERP